MVMQLVLALPAAPVPSLLQETRPLCQDKRVSHQAKGLSQVLRLLYVLLHPTLFQDHPSIVTREASMVESSPSPPRVPVQPNRRAPLHPHHLLFHHHWLSLEAPRTLEPPVGSQPCDQALLAPLSSTNPAPSAHRDLPEVRHHPLASRILAT